MNRDETRLEAASFAVMYFLARHMSVPLAVACGAILLLYATPVPEFIAFVTGNGGILTAIGKWTVPTAPDYNQPMNPMVGVMAVLASALFTRVLTSKTWYDLAGKDNCLFLIGLVLAFSIGLVTLALTYARYNSYFAFHY